MNQPGIDPLVQTLAPGGRLRSMGRLRGGLGALMHVLDIERADGRRFKVSLRRIVPGKRDSSPEAVSAAFERLKLVEAAGIPAPRPLLLDAEGRFFGTPCMVLTYIAGSPLYQPADRAVWASDLAAAAARIHAVTPETHDLSSLRVALKEQIRASLDEHAEGARASTDPMVHEVYEALVANLDRIGWPPPCLVHDDFWLGNTVWHRGRLKAVIDWEDAKLGDRRSDIAQAQMEIAFTVDIETADLFVDAYERLAGTLPQLWYFQLYRGISALFHVGHWLTGYADAGLILEPDTVQRELRAFLRRALDQAGAFSLMER